MGCSEGYYKIIVILPLFKHLFASLVSSNLGEWASPGGEGIVLPRVCLGTGSSAIVQHLCTKLGTSQSVAVERARVWWPSAEFAYWTFCLSFKLHAYLFPPFVGKNKSWVLTFRPSRLSWKYTPFVENNGLKCKILPVSKRITLLSSVSGFCGKLDRFALFNPN